MKRALRYALAAGLAVAALGTTAPAANAAVCHPDFEFVCVIISIPCQRFGDNPKLHNVVCPPIG